MGVWIETTETYRDCGGKDCHTLRGCVDWNRDDEGQLFIPPQSHPTWVCGLKLQTNGVIGIEQCHTLRGCVDWNGRNTLFKKLREVTPYVGVWIETYYRKCRTSQRRSHPTWVCGLKRGSIEEFEKKVESHPTWVCGLKLSIWIWKRCLKESHPTWVCGLKHRRVKKMW